MAPKLPKSSLVQASVRSLIRPIFEKAGAAVANMSPEQQAEIRKAFAQSAGRISPSAKRNLPELIKSGVLVHPIAAKLFKSAPARAIAAGLAKPLDELLADVVSTTVRANRKKYAPVLERLGNPSIDGMVVIFKKVVLWAELEGAGLDGQVANFSGRLFERARKTMPDFRRSAIEAVAAVEEHNRQLVAGGMALPVKDLDALVAREQAAGNSQLFRRPAFFDNVLDGDGKELTDGMRLSFNGPFNVQEEVLLLGWDEVKFWSVAEKVYLQFDKVLRRVRARGIKLPDGRFFKEDKIRFPKRAGSPSGKPALSLNAYLENVSTGPLITPGGLAIRRITVPQADSLRELVRDFLIRYRKMLLK